VTLAGGPSQATGTTAQWETVRIVAGGGGGLSRDGVVSLEARRGTRDTRWPEGMVWRAVLEPGERGA